MNSLLTHLIFIIGYAICFASTLSLIHNDMIKKDWKMNSLGDVFHSRFTYLRLLFAVGCSIGAPGEDWYSVLAVLASIAIMWMIMHFIFEVKLNRLRGLHPYYVSYSTTASLTDKTFVKAGKIFRLPATIVSKLSKILFTAIALGLYIWLMVA